MKGATGTRWPGLSGRKSGMKQGGSVPDSLEADGYYEYQLDYALMLAEIEKTKIRKRKATK